jgi:2-polyprenyl-3-methyl-5-hydroxy-6-metoxy-1,4-benzoquinol methylase
MTLKFSNKIFFVFFIFLFLHSHTVLGETEDPLFPQKNLDMIIMVYVLHMLEKPLEYIENLKKYMKPETQLVIIERNTNIERAHYPAFMTKKQILYMIEKTNYKLERIDTFLRNFV